MIQIRAMQGISAVGRHVPGRRLPDGCPRLCEVSAFLKRYFPVFLYEDFQRADQAFTAIINDALSTSNVFLVFAGEALKSCQYCIDEINSVLARIEGRPQIVPVLLHEGALSTRLFE